jgi:SAM-dependent methyltransferase
LAVDRSSFVGHQEKPMTAVTTALSNFTDPNFLTSRSYATQEKLAIRAQTHARYTVPPLDFPAWVMQQLEWHGRELIVDIGCGHGNYTAWGLSLGGLYIAADLSIGMLRDLLFANLRRVNLDIQQLPFAGQVVDVVLANHMLYHVPRLDNALSEIRRLLKPHGRLVAATNSVQGLPQLNQLLDETAASFGFDLQHTQTINNQFSLESGAAALERHFARVERYDIDNQLVFPAPKPVLAYVNSMDEWYRVFLPAAVEWADFMTALHARLESHFAQHSQFRVDKKAGFFLSYPE